MDTQQRKFGRWGSAWQNQYRARRKAQAVCDRGGHCQDCGFDLVAFPECADFDHRPGEVKLFNISGSTVTNDTFASELAKCDLVCANCHRIRTRARAVAVGYTGKFRRRSDS